MKATRGKRVSYTEANIHSTYKYKSICKKHRHEYLGSEMNVSPSKLFFSHFVVPWSWRGWDIYHYLKKTLNKSLLDILKLILALKLKLFHFRQYGWQSLAKRKLLSGLQLWWLNSITSRAKWNKAKSQINHWLGLP